MKPKGAEENNVQNALRSKLETLQKQCGKLANIVLEKGSGVPSEIRKMFSALTHAGAIMAMLFTATVETGHTLTRYKVFKHLTAGGIVYKHEDKETTDILNYLSGKGELPAYDRVIFYRRAVERMLEEYDQPVPKDLERMNEKQLRAVLTKLYREKLPIEKQHYKDIPRYIDYAFEVMAVPRYQPNKKLYISLWKLEQETGAPKIRWAQKEKGHTGMSDEKRYNGIHSYYSSITNTIHIQPGRYLGDMPVENLIDEASHAFQFGNWPLSSATENIIDSMATELRAVWNDQNVAKSQDEEYDMPGTVEYEAHKVIEPFLKAEFKGEKIKYTYDGVAGESVIK